MIFADDIVFNEEKIDAIVGELNTTYDKIIGILSNVFIEITAVTKFSPEWKFMIVSFYLLHLLEGILKTSPMIGTTTSAPLYKNVKNMIKIGIYQNISPQLPNHVSIRKKDIEITEKYYMLRASVLGLYHYASLSSLNRNLFQSTLNALYIGLFQLAYCPLMEPNQRKDSFVMTTELHDEVHSDQMRCREILYFIRQNNATSMIIFQLSLLMKPSNPKWFANAVVQHLNFCLERPHGIRALFSLMGQMKTNEVSQKPVNVLAKLVSMTTQSEEFDSLILPQIEELLCKNGSDKGHVLLFGEILKHIYRKDEKIGSKVLEKILCPLKNLARDTECLKINPKELSKLLIGVIKVISYAFVNSLDKLPFHLIKSYMSILFNIYMFLEDNDPLLLLGDLQNTLIAYCKSINNKSENVKLFENLMFNMQSNDYKIPLYNVLILPNKGKLELNFHEKNIKYDILLSAKSIFTLFKSEPELEIKFFVFLISCIVNSEKYFADFSLLVTEDEGHLSTFEKKLAVLEMLKILSSKDTVKNYFKNNVPEELLEYFDKMFKKAIITGAHDDPDHDSYQGVFAVALLLYEIRLEKSYNLDGSEVMNSAKELHKVTKNLELKTLLAKTLTESEDELPTTREMDEVEKHIQEALSRSIEVQGHGLIALKKLIVKKHPKAVERKQFIFTIFQVR